MKLARLLAVPCDLWLGMIDTLPGPLGRRLRYGYWRRRLRHLGRNVRIDPGAHFHHPERISIADNAFIDRHAIVLAGVDTGDREMIDRRPNRPLDIEPGCVSIGINV